MTELSPAAQVAINAWRNAYDGEYISGVWTPNRSAQLAAALEAAADQVVPEEELPVHARGTSYWHKAIQRSETRDAFLAIAAELRGGTTQEDN